MINPRASALFLIAASAAYPQSASLRGVVTDPSGGIVQKARITLTTRGQAPHIAESAADGAYSFTGIAPGAYALTADAPDLALAQPLRYTVKPGGQTLDIQLTVRLERQKLTVEDNAAPAVGLDAASNASALVLKGRDLEALADNPDDLAADLQALAGPSAGPNGGSIYIDGFSGGQLPSKESIREIRINQNPFAPEYDRLGFGRIEIFTKPGTDKFRGVLFFNVGHDSMNTRNPYAAEKAPFLLKEYGGNVSGPLGKKASYFVDIQRHAIDNGAIVNTTTLDPATLAIINPFTAVPVIPQVRTSASPRVDYQINTNNTLSLRYTGAHTDIQDSGTGGFNLLSRGIHFADNTHTGQLSETAVLGASVINETRFQVIRTDSTQTANQSGPAIQVLSAFNGGGSTIGASATGRSSHELQNYTSVIRGGHTIRFGVRVRGEALDSYSPQNFNGTFTFGGGNGLTSIERYQRTLIGLKAGQSLAQIRAAGGGPTQFSITAGQPALSANQWDTGFFFGDDWRVKPNLTLNLGARYETQTNIHDFRDIAPRVGFAWAPGAHGKVKPKSVIRGGFGMFYDRFPLAGTLAAMRYNGVVQRQFVIPDPNFFPGIPAIDSFGAAVPQTTQIISKSLKTPYIMQTAIAFERQLPGNTTMAITYAGSRVVHVFRGETIPGASPVFVMASSGLYNQNQLIVNANTKVTKDISLFGSYVNNHAKSNSDGLGTFPADPRNYTGEYGPASTDIRNRGNVGGTITTWKAIRLSPMFTAETGPPFDITAGRDIYGTTLFNGRPGIATDASRPGLVRTAYGLLDPNPIPGEAILGRNAGLGPGSVMFNLRLARTWTFGRSAEGGGGVGSANIPGGGDGRRQQTGVFNTAAASGGAASGGGARRYGISFSLSIRNALNHNNPGPIIGNITSPLFGRANQAAGQGGGGGGTGPGFSESANNRRLEWQTRLTF